MNSKRISLVLLPLAVFASACASKPLLSVAASSEKFQPQTAYFVSHGGRSVDMDAHIQQSLLTHKISAQVGSDMQKNESVDMIVKYHDIWRWDLTMYLKAMDIEFYNAKTGVLMAQGNWENSRMHDIQNVGGAVSDVIDAMFAKINTGTGNGTAASTSSVTPAP